MSEPFAAVRDIGEPCGDEALQMYGFPAQQACFNAGVLLLDIKQLCAKRVLESARSFAMQHSMALTYHEQDVLNLLAQGRWLALEFTWNVQVRNMRRIFLLFSPPLLFSSNTSLLSHNTPSPHTTHVYTACR